MISETKFQLLVLFFLTVLFSARYSKAENNIIHQKASPAAGILPKPYTKNFNQNYLLPPMNLEVDSQCSTPCCGSAVGGSTPCVTGVKVIGGTAPFTYMWSTGDTTKCITIPGPGVYFVTVMDAMGNIATLQVVVQPGICCKLVCPNDTTICFQVPDSLVKLGKPKVVSTTPQQPDPCYADSIWNNSTGVYPVGTTVITWYARYPDGHIDTCKQNVIRNPPINVNISFTTSPAAVAGVINICNGQSITFTNTSTGITGQLWNFGNGNYSSNATYTQVYTFPPGTYTVTLTNYDACGNKYDTTLTVIVDPSTGPDIECISVVCPGDTVTYHTNANCTTYNWSVIGGTIISTPLNNDSITVVWGAGPTGTISLSVSGCTPPSTCAIATVKTVHIVPATLPVNGDSIVCSGSKSTYCVACIPGNIHTWTILPVAAYDSIKYNDCCVTIYWSKTFFGTVSVNVNYNNILNGAGCALPDGCNGDEGCGGSGNLTVTVRPIFGIAGPSKVCPNSLSATFNGMNLTNNTIAPGVSWKLITPVPSTLTFANTALLNAYTWNAGIGVYSLTAYAPPGIYCNDSATIAVEVVEIKIPNVITGPDTVCPGTTHFYTVQPNMSGVQYIWNVTGAGSPAGTTITAAPSLAVTWGAGGGTISVQQQLLASPFCTSVATTALTVVTYPPFALPAITANPGGASCLKSSVTYCYTGSPIPNATYLWSVVPATAGNITSANGGNCITIQWVDGTITPIFVKLKISRCYDDSVMFPVTLLALPPVPNINYSPLVICKNTPVNFSTTSAGPVWNWNFGDAGTSPLQNPVHTYTTAGNFNVSLTVTNANGCSDTAFTTVKVEDVPVLPVITGTTSACLNSFGTYTFSQPFFPGAAYNWSLSGGGVITAGQGSNTISVQWTTPGSHQVFLSVTSLCPAGSVIPFNVTVNPLPVAGITLPNPSCVGAPLTFTGTGGVSYSWSFSGGTPSSSTASSPVVTYPLIGTYPVSLTVTDANGCTATSLTNITIHELPIAFITTPDANGCTFPYAVNIYAVNSGGYSFNWIPTSTSGPSLSTIVTSTTTYSVLVTNQYGCTQLSNAITFTNGNCAPAPPQPGDCITQDSINFTWTPPLCLQDSFFVTGSALPPFTWFFDYAGATATGNAVSNTYTYPGYYKVVVCGMGRGFIFPAMTTPCPNVPICKMNPVKIPFDARFNVSYACNGSNQMQTIINNTSIWAGANTYTWNWYLDGSGTPFSSATNPPNQLFSSGPHTITLIISDPGAGNTLGTCTLTVPINVPVPIVASFTSPAQICKGFAAAFLDTSTPSALTRSWTSPGAPSTTTNPANLIYTVAGPTTVTLNVSDIYGCTSTASTNVNVQMGTGTLTVTNNNSCDSVQLVASGNPNFIWTYFSPVPPVTASSVWVKSSGYYSVTAIDPSNGCPYSASSGLVTVKQPPVATITGKTNYCQGDKLDLKTSSAGSVVWRYDFDSYVSIQGTLPNMNNVASIPGTFIYQVTVTGANGCTATASITIVVDPVPGTASIVGSPTTICDGDSVQLSVTPPGVTYLWSKTPPPALSSPANTAPSIWVKQSGTYSVIVQTANGCYYPAIAPKTITVNPLPAVKISGDTVLCEGETLLLTTINVGGATYLWSGPGGSGTSNPLQINNMLVSGSGTYTVTVTNSFGCTASASINVIVHPNPVVPVIASNVPGVLCEGQLYTDSVTPGTIDGSLTPLQYVWNTGQQGYSIFVAKAGSYFVTATNQWGCSSVSNVLTIHPLPDLSCVPTGCYDFCTECDSVEIPGPLGLASYQWQILTGGIFVNYSNTQNLKVYTPGGKFRLIAANQWGCADSTDTLDIKFHDCCFPVDTVNCVDSVCQEFNGTGTQGFGPYPPAPNVNIIVSNTGGQYPGDQYLRVTDLAGPSAVVTDTLYNGKWCCGKFYYDFKIFDDGVTGTVNVQPKFRIYNIALGKAFEFTSNIIINENSPWTRITACTGLDSLPVNQALGIWTPVAPATAADWTAVASNITSVIIITQVNSNNNEVVGIDNVCFVPEHLIISCNKVVTCENTTVNVTVIENGGCSTLKYLWSNGATTSSLSFVAPGTYCVTVSNCCGCVDSCCVTVDVPNIDTLHVTDTVYHVTCDSIYGGIDVTVTGGVPPYSYQWNTGEQTQDINGLTAGVYTLTVTDSIGCIVIIHDTVLINAGCNCNAVPPPPGPTITINSIVADSCNNSGCIHATFTGCCLRYSYSYFDPCDPANSYSVAQTTDSTIFCNLKAGNYIIYVQDPCGNIASQTVVIPLVNGPLTVSYNYTSCADSICLTVEGGCPPYTYLWLGGATTQCITGLPPCTDTYVTVTDSRGCSELIYITVPHFTFPVVAQPTCCLANGRICVEVCFGQQPYTFLWSNGATTNCINGLAPGTYCVTVTNANGATVSCCYTLTAAAIQPPSISFQFTQCGNNVTAVVSSNCPYTAHWENGTAGLTRDNLTECDTITLTVILCDGTVYTHTAQVPHVTATITPVNCSTGVGSACITLSCFGCGPYTYNWQGNPVCPPSTDSCFSCVAGSYQVCITNCNGDVVCCNFIIPATPPIIISLLSKVNPTSALPSSGAISITVSGGTPGYTYLWSNGATTQNVSGLTTGTYTVTVTDANGCTSVKTFVLTISCKLSYTTVVVQPASCYLNNGIITVIPSGGTSYTYLWLTSPVQTTATATGLPFGSSVTVIITDISGCSITASIVAPTSLGLGVTFTSTNVSCYGGSNGTITTTVTGSTPPYTYLWSNGATTANLSGIPAGFYTVTVTSGGCDAIATIKITQPPGIIINISKNNPGCGLSNGSAASLASGGTPPYSYSWNTIPAQTTATATGLGAGIYTVTVTDANGCTKTKSTTLSSASALLVTGIVTPVKCFGASNGSINITPSGGLPAYTYLWSNGATTKDQINVLATGTYTITVTDSKGCTAQFTAIVPQPPLLTVTASATNVSCYGGINGTLSAIASGGTPPYSYTWNTVPAKTGSFVTGIKKGTYTVIVTDSKGCMAAATVTITQPPAITIAISKTNVTTPGGSNGTATATASGGTPGYVYSWNSLPVQTTSTATGLSAGVYTVTVTDANGCTKTRSVTINQPLPKAGANNPEPIVYSTLFPNPASGLVNIAFSEELTTDVKISIYNSSGQRVYDLLHKPSSQNSTIEINLSAMPKGIYTVKYYTNERSWIEKLVLQ